MCVCVCVCGVIKPNDIYPPFVLGLRPIITYEEDSGDHGNPRNHVEDNLYLSSASQSRGRRKVIYRQRQSFKALQEKR